MSKNTVNRALTRRRVGNGDIEALSDLIRLSHLVEATIRDAVINLRNFGYSWAEIADRLGVSRQAAQQRWGGEPR
jgi:hypothetical protein